MSDDTDSWGFTPPPFNAEAALLQLQRSLRELGLTERTGVFELKGRQALSLQLQDGTIAARLARRLTLRSPDWDPMTLRSGADSRKLLDEVKRRLARWSDED